VRTIAVLPFKPLVAEDRDEALELGMADTLIARLSSSRGTLVRPLSSVRRYSALDQDALAAGSELGVQSVLDGSIQRRENQIRVTARLISVPDGLSLWTQTFDEEFTDVFAVQDTISERVAAALALRVSAEEKKGLTQRYTENVEAYHLYLKGWYHLGKLTAPAIRKGIEFFHQAIDIDPLYALAHAGLADAYRRLPMTSDVPSKDVCPKGKAAAMAALEIDEELADAHVTLGFLKFWFDRDWAGAEKELRRGIDLRPNSGQAHMAYAILLTALGRFDEGIQEGRRAAELDPLTLIINATAGWTLYCAHRDDDARAKIDKALDLDPNFWVALLFSGRLHARKGAYPEAIAALTKARECSGGNSETIAMIAHTWARAGNRAKARSVLAELKSQATERYVPPLNIAVIYNGLDDKDEALRWLEKAYDDRDVRLAYLKVDPAWDSFRSDPRFTAFLMRVGFA
jgi:serine/threonine-protein kinase